MKQSIWILAAVAILFAACNKEDKQVDQPSPIESITFSEESVSMNEGAKFYAYEYLAIMPTSVGDTATVTWGSSNEAVATVNEYGTVTAKKAGETTIMATSNSKSATLTVIVNRIPITKMTVPDKMSLPMKVWKTVPITVEPENASTGNLRFHFFCDNPKDNHYAKPRVEYKDGTWWMICEQSGNFHFDAICDESGDSIRSEVNVYSIPATQIDFAQSTYKVNIGDTISTSLIWTPDSASFQDATYTSDDITIATVDKKGVILGVKEGAVTITAKTGSLTATCTATVGNFVYKPVESLTCSIDHIWMWHDQKVTIPQSAFTVSPADATHSEVSITVEGNPNNVSIVRTTDGWTLTATDNKNLGRYTGNLIVKADNKTVKIPLMVFNSRFWNMTADAFEKLVTANPEGCGSVITVGQSLPADLGEHIKLQLTNYQINGYLESVMGYYPNQKVGAFSVVNGTQPGIGQYITKPQKLVVQYTYVFKNTSYYYVKKNQSKFRTTTYTWKMTLNGIYGKEDSVYTHTFEQKWKSGFSHYKMTISSPTKVYYTARSMQVYDNEDGTKNLQVYDRNDYYYSHFLNDFTLLMQNETDVPEIAGEAAPVTITVTAYADYQEKYPSDISLTYTFSNGTVFWQKMQELMNRSSNIVRIGKFGVISDEQGMYDEIGLDCSAHKTFDGTLKYANHGTDFEKYYYYNVDYKY